jgi:hypothetical protein
MPKHSVERIGAMDRELRENLNLYGFSQCIVVHKQTAMLALESQTLSFRQGGVGSCKNQM